jgi:colanic acid/amylovoran biosynthesis glycosyltransferase
LGTVLKQCGLIRGSFLTTFYGYDISSHVKQYGPDLYRHLFRSCDRVLCLSEYMQQELIRLHCPRARIRIHHLGVDLSRFTFAVRTRRPDRGVNLFTPARLVEKKGLEYAIRAVGQLVDRHPSICFRIAGDGPLRKDLEALIARLKLERHVQLLGWQTQDQVVKQLNEADIFLAPSVTAADGDQEGTPTVLIEALAQGLPVVSTLHSGIPEIVRDGESGFLVPERDVEALADRIGFLIEHPELWAKMGAAGRAHVEKHFDSNKVNDRLVELYEELYREKKDPPGTTAKTRE